MAQTIKAYEDKEVVYYDAKERKQILKSGTPSEKAGLYTAISQLLHYWDSDKDFFKQIDSEKDQLRADEDEAQKQVAQILRQAGYKVHVNTSEGRDEDPEQEHYIHFTFGICMHQIPKYESWNEDVREYLFNEDGSVKSYDDFLKAFYEAKGINPDVDEDVQEAFNDLDEDLQNAVKELLENEGEDLSDVTEIREENDGVYLDFGYKSYVVMTEDEAQEKAEEYIKDSVWAFNTGFIQAHCKGDIDGDVIKAIQDKCESGNDAMTSLIEDMDEFIEDAISADGRGHFLSTYDGEEHELNNGYVYIRDN